MLLQTPGPPDVSKVDAIEDQMSSLVLQRPPSPSPVQEEPSTTPLVGHLGQLGTLPPEVRAMIFRDHMATHSTNLLLANHSLYLEFITNLNEDFELVFVADPTDYYSRVRIVSVLNQSERVVECLGYHRDAILDDWPVDQFNSVTIDIEAPDVEDAGQLVRCWRQVTSLISALGPKWRYPRFFPLGSTGLKRGKGRKNWGLPPITVNFKDVVTVANAVVNPDPNGKGKESRRWTRDSPWQRGERLWNHSVPRPSDWDDDWDEDTLLASWTKKASVESESAPAGSDIEIILSAFLELRGAQSFKVNLPPSGPSITHSVHVRGLLALIQHSVERDASLESRSQIEMGMDISTLIRVDCEHLWLDYLLDDLEGPTAAIMRRQRLQAWCCEYEYLTMERLEGYYRGWDVVGGAENSTILSEDLLYDMEQEFCSRFATGQYLRIDHMKICYDLHFWVPDFPDDGYDFSTHSYWYCEHVKLRTHRTVASLVDMNCFSRKAWEIFELQWPKGMPRKSEETDDDRMSWAQGGRDGMRLHRDRWTSNVGYCSGLVIEHCASCRREKKRYSRGEQVVRGRGRRTVNDSEDSEGTDFENDEQGTEAAN